MVVVVLQGGRRARSRAAPRLLPGAATALRGAPLRPLRHGAPEEPRPADPEARAAVGGRDAGHLGPRGARLRGDAMSRLSQKPELRPAREHAPGALAALESAYDAAAVAIDPTARRLPAPARGREPRPEGTSRLGVARLGARASLLRVRRPVRRLRPRRHGGAARGGRRGARPRATPRAGADDLRVRHDRPADPLAGTALRAARSRGRGPRARRAEAARRRCRRPARRPRCCCTRSTRSTTELVRLHCARYHDCKT